MRLWLKKYRMAAALSQKEISEQAGITQQFYNYIENGVRRPSPETAQKLAAILGFEWTQFFLDETETSA